MSASSRSKKKRKRLPELVAMARLKGEETGEDMAITNFLGDDTVLNVLQRIPTRALLSVMALVCRRWRRLCQEHLVRTSILCIRFTFLLDNFCPFEVEVSCRKDNICAPASCLECFVLTRK